MNSPTLAHDAYDHWPIRSWWPTYPWLVDTLPLTDRIFTELRTDSGSKFRDLDPCRLIHLKLGGFSCGTWRRRRSDILWQMTWQTYLARLIAQMYERTNERVLRIRAAAWISPPSTIEFLRLSLPSPDGRTMRPVTDLNRQRRPLN